MHYISGEHETKLKLIKNAFDLNFLMAAMFLYLRSKLSNAIHYKTKINQVKDGVTFVLLNEVR
jgi:hypothetical protein